MVGRRKKNAHLEMLQQTKGIKGEKKWKLWSKRRVTGEAHFEIISQQTAQGLQKGKPEEMPLRDLENTKVGALERGKTS